MASSNGPAPRPPASPSGSIHPRALILLAGLYESWRPDPQNAPDDWRRTFTILTTDANATVAPIHDRMPVILTPDHAAEWVYEGNDADTVRPLLRPAAPSSLVAEPVSRRVNSVKNDDAGCIVVQPQAELASQGALFE